MWAALILAWVVYNVIGCYVSYTAFKNGYIRMMVPHEWAFAVSSWPWLLWHVHKVNKERNRMQPFEDYMDRYEENQIDKRLKGLE